MSELKPCPFCGKYPQTVVDDATEEKFGVKCFNCGGMIDAEKDTLQEAIEAWNKRVPSAQPEIIRCKDCENLQTDWKPQDSDGYYCAVMDRMMEEDGFCSHAERKENVQ